VAAIRSEGEPKKNRRSFAKRASKMDEKCPKEGFKVSFTQNLMPLEAIYSFLGASRSYCQLQKSCRFEYV